MLSCTENTPPPIEDKAENSYFSLKDFFQSEIKKLQSQQIVLHKYANLNKEQEKKALHEINWATEFSPFLQSDINKPAWKDSYQIDSIANKLGMLEIKYTTLKPELRTQEISLVFQKGQTAPRLIKIANQSRNPIYNSTEKLQYEVGKSYLIENEQHIMWMNPDVFSIKGELIFNKGNR